MNMCSFANLIIHFQIQGPVYSAVVACSGNEKVVWIQEEREITLAFEPILRPLSNFKSYLYLCFSRLFTIR